MKSFRNILLLLLCFSGNISYCSEVLPKESFDSFIENSRTEWKIPGCAVAIVHGGKIIYNKGFGYSNLKTKKSVDENTLFQIGSITKSFTALSAALLEQQNKCSLNDPIKIWFNEFKLKDPYRTNSATLLDALCHRIGYEFYTGEFFMFNTSLIEKQVLEKYSKLDAVHPFRYQYSYCNIGYYFVGKCIEKISGMSLTEYFEEIIFKKIGMKNSKALPSEISKSENYCTGYTLKDSLMEIPYAYFDMLTAAGGICSSSSDMAKYMLELLKAYNGTSDVFPGDVMNRFLTPQEIMGMSDGKFHKNHFIMYALGGVVEDYEGCLNFWSAGGINGFNAQISLFPEKEFGIIVLTNRDNHQFGAGLKLDLINAMLGIEHENITQQRLNYFNTDLTETKKYLAIMEDSVRNYNSSAAAISGIYKNDIYGFSYISKSDNSYEITFEHYHALKGTLRQISKARFYCTFNDPGFPEIVITFTNLKSPAFLLDFGWSVDSYVYEFRRVKS